MKNTQLWLVIEALEKVGRAQKFQPVYDAVLKKTGDKKQALEAQIYVTQVAEDLEDEATPSNG